jgi:hypothetical protein
MFVLVTVSVLAMSVLTCVIVIDPLTRMVTTLVVQRSPSPTIRPTTAVVMQITDVPTVTAVPPTPTPTETPTPVPPTLTPSITPTPTETTIPTETPIPPTATRRIIPTAAQKRCVAVVGDSVAHGDAVFEIPGVGYLQAQFAPVSTFIAFRYAQPSSVNVLNRTSAAVGISSGRHPSYFNTPEYAQLIQDGCQYTVIIPWINDLSSGSDASVAGPNHVRSLATLAQTLANKNPNGKILIVNYYQGAAAPFALNSFASGFTPGNIAAFNQHIAAACSGGALLIKGVVCVDANAIFGGMGGAHVIGPVNRDTLKQLQIAPSNPEQENMVEFYFRNNPGGMLTGDGVHLSNAGKAQLAAYLVPMMP